MMKQILLIQTGGTIAMNFTKDDNPRLDSPSPNDAIYQKIPELSEIAHIDTICPFFEDSSDITLQHWERLGKCVLHHYNVYDGFVILHGTDTMAYAASALSFQLKSLKKPVIFTGSMVPMASLRSDARRNLVNAVEIATMPLPDVGICFNDFVYRGNRTTKMSIGDFDAFASPNYPPLAKIGLNIRLNEEHILQTNDRKDIFTKKSGSFSDEVFLLKIYPGLKAEILQRLHLTGIRAIVIEAFGSGNFPLSEKTGLLHLFEECFDAGITLVITSQAPYDAVDLTKYESGRAAAALGAVGAGDMTTEATLTKIMYLLGKLESNEEVKRYIQINMAGELTQ
jgi:L-asparaginase